MRQVSPDDTVLFEIYIQRPLRDFAQDLAGLGGDRLSFGTALQPLEKVAKFGPARRVPTIRPIYLPHRRRMLQWWADFVEKPTNVIQIAA
jgi:hypothetical protein